jgi:antitoxin VapB
MQSTERHVKLFRIGCYQAVRIPVEFELPGTDAVMIRDGDKLVIAPIRKGGLSALLDPWEPLLDDFPEIGDRPITSEDVL